MYDLFRGLRLVLLPLAFGAILVAATACSAVPKAPAGSPSLAAMLEASTLVDLTHSYDATTLYWPTDTFGFRLEEVSKGINAAGFFYAANRFCTAEHGGTHLDAPIHFAEHGASIDQLALGQLLAPAVVIDVTAKTAADADYRLSAEDVAAFEAAHGKIAPGSIVLLRTGWGKFWPQRKPYFGDDRPGETGNLHFPSYGIEAAKLLVEGRQVAALGLDTPSIDYGPSKDFLVHREAGAHGVAGFENLRNLDCLPPTGAYLIALPMKIGGGSGGPLRAVALLPPGTAAPSCPGK